MSDERATVSRTPSTSWRFGRRALLTVVLATLVFTVGLAPSAANAASNGQQVGIYCNTSQTTVDRIMLSGTNQSGNHAFFDGTPSNAASMWLVWGWWWKGQIEAWWHIPNRGWYYIKTTVPTYQPIDIYALAQC